MKIANSKNKWLEPQKTQVPNSLQIGVGGHPLVANTLVRRGISDLARGLAFLDQNQYIPAPSTDLPDLDLAVNRLQQAIKNQETILVWGDFDVDGQTSTTLLVEVLRDLDAQVVYHIPLRETESHGIKISFLQKIIDEHMPSLLLTCDTGISEHKAVDYANQRGMDVIVTDHHDLPPVLPNALALVNGNRLPNIHPLHSLPGVGIAYKVCEELYRRRGRIHSCDHYLDLVALGIVADVAVQSGDTRFLLQKGLQELRKTQRLGLQYLMESAKISMPYLNEEDIGFRIGPRLNALGRLDNAEPIVEFLTSEDIVKIKVIAARLEGLNERRKLLTDQIFLAAQAQIDQDQVLLNYGALVLAHPDWHPGVIGIVANQLVERYHLPVVLLSTPNGEMARGSARSIKGIDISQAISTQKNLLVNFGGHPMAAGLSLPPENISAFRHGLSRTIKGTLDSESIQVELPIDAYLNLDELTLNLVDDLDRLAPFGAGNPALIIATCNLQIVRHTKFGVNKKHLRIVVKDTNDHVQEIVWWRGSEQSLPDGLFDLAYRASANFYKGERRLHLQWVDFRQESGSFIENEFKPNAFKIVDFRQKSESTTIIELQKSKGKIQIWAEGPSKPTSSTVDRLAIINQDQLAIWTAPPSSEVLENIISLAAPKVVYLCGFDPGIDELELFLKQLIGLVKFTINNKHSLADLAELAAVTSQRKLTIQLGLLWLEANGDIQILDRSGDIVSIVRGTRSSSNSLSGFDRQLRGLLQETAAYRKYIRLANIESIFDQS